MSEKKSYEDLEQALEACPLIGSTWKHYKDGGLYEVGDRVIRESTREPEIVYGQVGAFVSFVRPLSEWEELVEWAGKKVPRFTKVG